VEILVARTFAQRLKGLALRRRPPSRAALLIARCSSVHTFGMRFALDLIWLDPDAEILRVDHAVPPGRVRSCPGAAGVIEAPAGQAGIIAAVAQRQRSRLGAALDPRQPIYRDSYNEYFVFILSALGAGMICPLVLYVAMAATGLWGLLPFVAGCVLLELALIFGIARPRMKAREALGWALLWGATTALLAAAFYELVAKPTL
jgi:hypothetical protein